MCYQRAKSTKIFILMHFTRSTPFSVCWYPLAHAAAVFVVGSALRAEIWIVTVAEDAVEEDFLKLYKLSLTFYVGAQQEIIYKIWKNH